MPTEYDPNDYKLVQSSANYCCIGCCFWKCVVCLVENDDRFDCGTPGHGYTYENADQGESNATSA